jgi:hypothetical protein
MVCDNIAPAAMNPRAGRTIFREEYRLRFFISIDLGFPVEGNKGLMLLTVRVVLEVLEK